MSKQMIVSFSSNQVAVGSNGGYVRLCPYFRVC